MKEIQILTLKYPFGINEWFSLLFFHFLHSNKISQFAMHGICTLPPGYGAGGLEAGAQLTVRLQGKAFNSLGSRDAFK